MMQHAWNGYVKYAWGSNELRPSSLSSHSASIFGSSMGATIVDALDTLHIMGMHDEFKKAKDWIAKNLKFQGGGEASVFEITIRFVGGLLSAYALTKDKVFKNKAEELADKLMPAFNTRTGIPRATINLASGGSRNWGWAAGGSSILAEIGTLHLEFAYLSKVTGKEKYVQAVDRIRSHLNKIDKPRGLYPVYISPDSGSWVQDTVTLGALGDSFYEYLIKSYVMSGKKDEVAKKMYYNVVESINSNMIKKSPSLGLTYLAELHGGHPSSKMDHLACFAGGMFALGGYNHPDPAKGKEQVRLGAEITSSCHETYIKSATRIGPEAFHFDQGNEARAIYGNEKYYILRPETIESYFVLWRMTHDEKYRDWGWDAAQAIEKHCKAAAGYSGIRDVYTVPAQQDDVQQSFFLAETLKYLYLLFSDDDVIPLDKWVLNTEAHPLPVDT
ncbi:uncharacterized protein TRIADDRAFT_25192 [Trichoplax adhaerens]|uniref:alpha-1,2-Mannosidase n=1 Tax=Trichoplax adhaerens TaxID=10228 RepID=B3RY16_TRIAD|nr:hypothetical protein TRIADDRAFT_25192 [Trichoplax adhaerens]EDV24955.1 hypothetical protein TRIADDRAFT_25192 [Trichoplax adhaerens]|eukprot:XP_002112845.1 hypothetical protein TRIADDRAFT_25192 [Trichoplax adhaerens]